MSKSTSISYRQVGDFKISNIILPPEQVGVTPSTQTLKVRLAVSKGSCPFQRDVETELTLFSFALI